MHVAASRAVDSAAEKQAPAAQAARLDDQRRELRRAGRSARPRPVVSSPRTVSPQRARSIPRARCVVPPRDPPSADRARQRIVERAGVERLGAAVARGGQRRQRGIHVDSRRRCLTRELHARWSSTPETRPPAQRPSRDDQQLAAPSSPLADRVARPATGESSCRRRAPPPSARATVPAIQPAPRVCC